MRFVSFVTLIFFLVIGANLTACAHLEDKAPVSSGMTQEPPDESVTSPRRFKLTPDSYVFHVKPATAPDSRTFAQLVWSDLGALILLFFSAVLLIVSLTAAGVRFIFSRKQRTASP